MERLRDAFDSLMRVDVPTFQAFIMDTLMDKTPSMRLIVQVGFTNVLRVVESVSAYNRSDCLCERNSARRHLFQTSKDIFPHSPLVGEARYLKILA